MKHVIFFISLPAIGIACLSVSAQELSVSPFVVRYVAPDESVARDALAILQEAMVEYGRRLPAGERPVVIIICGTVLDFRRHAGLFARPSVGGIAKPEEGVIIVRSPRILESPGDFKGILRHELVHVLLARNTNTDNMPSWLNEGLAMMLSKEHRWNSTFRVAYMYLQGQLIPYRDLDMSLQEPGIETEFGDAYAESLSMARYLGSRVGEDRLWEIVSDLKEMSFGDALRARAGLSPLDFWEAWRSSLWKVALISSIVSGFTIFQVMALLTILAYMRKRRRGKQIMREWEEEEKQGRVSRAVTLPGAGYLSDDEDDEYEGPPWEEDDEEYR